MPKSPARRPEGRRARPRALALCCPCSLLLNLWNHRHQVDRYSFVYNQDFSNSTLPMCQRQHWHPKGHLGFWFRVEIAAAPPGLPVADLDEALAVPVEALRRSLARDGARNVLCDDLRF